ncbi:hypothetical protein AB1Y20_000278 [Prymnesium parvum]|uniref:Costars domain-containing protein n=1 Tax=Prymnesium parvum TaxID=97485 RepID=A0AB34K5W5_PRYPA|mmetsp:Transcript_28688/g.69910  ORF Transcript_28688/g.69910 Transcript_28688/m.69910 type:complete len:319 (-) Transcript_28688:478-1434(-)
MAEHAGGAVSQRAAALAALQTSEKSRAPAESKESGSMTQREKAMAALNQKGVVNSREMRGVKGESQHAQAMKNLNLQDQPAKVVPNWKQTAAQKTASAVRKEIGAGAGAARAVFQSQESGDLPRATTPKAPKSFVPVASTSPPLKKAGSISRVSPPAHTPPSHPPLQHRGSSGANTAAEAEQMVDHDLALLVAGIKRLVEAGKGSVEQDGALLTTFGAIVDDEELEQQLESLVGTLKAGRKRGVIDWKGQLLLKGPDDAAPIKLLAPAGAAPTTPPAAPPTESNAEAEAPAADDIPAAAEPDESRPSDGAAEEPVALS